MWKRIISYIAVMVFTSARFVLVVFAVKLTLNAM
jgi:hypothetical protein